jgi:hypothetical protein
MMTVQIYENLILDGQLVGMPCCPSLPFHHPRLVELTEEDIQALLKHIHSCADINRRAGHYIATSSDRLGTILGSTACYRGYLGTWEIKDDQLFLVSIEGRFKLLGSEPLLADWFTGFLRVPRGPVVDENVRTDFGSVHRKELHILIELGRVTGTRDYSAPAWMRST